MKLTHQIFCAIFICAAVDHVKSIYQPNPQNHDHGNNFIDVDESPKTECPPDFTGQIAYAMDCRQYLNCWHGRGTIQSCSPGTMFNPRTKECDNPSKVKCRHYEGLSTNQGQRQLPALNQRFSQRHELAPLQCEHGASGLFANPNDCTKFLNCANGRTFHRDCGPGTAFNDVFKVCDWPHKVNCGTRPLNGVVNTDSDSSPYSHQNTNSYPNSNSNQNTNSYPNSNSNQYSNQNTNSYPNSNTNPYNNANSNSYPYNNANSNSHAGSYSGTREEPVYGEGLIDARMNTNSPSSRAHSQPPFPQNHHNQYNPTQRPSYQAPIFNRNNVRNHQFPSGQSNDGINTQNSFSSANPAHSSPSLFTAETINQPASHPIDQLPQESSPKTQFVQIPSQELLPPTPATPFSNKSAPKTQFPPIPSQELLPPLPPTPISNNRTGRIDDSIEGQLEDRLDWGNLGNSLDSTTHPTQSTIDDTLLTTETTPQQFPELNFMSSRVADDFNKYFSNPQPKSTAKVPPPPTTTEPSTESVSNVFVVYPSGFETIGSRCVEDHTGLHAHPYDCSRYVSCENGRITVQNCEAGFMFNPTLKICDFAPNVRNCNARPMDESDLYPTEATRKETTDYDNGQRPFNGLPDDTLNEIYGDDKRKKQFETTTQPIRFGFSQTTESISTVPTNPTAFFIPDMSVLPLESRKYPSNLYPDEQNDNQKPKNPQQGYGNTYPGSQNYHPEHQTPPNNHQFGQNDRQYPQNPQNNQQNPQNRQNPLFTRFGRPSQGGDVEADTVESRNFELDREGKGLFHSGPTETTTERRNVMKIPSGHDHVMPIYNRPTKTPATTISTPRPYTQQQNYNHIYYQPFTKPINDTQEKDETDYIPISEALKYLLRPYVARNDTKVLNSSEQMNKIENKLLDMIDDGTKNRGKSLEQDSLATAILNENVAVKNLPESPKTESRADFELISTTTKAKKDIEETTPHSYIPPVGHFHPHNHNSQHYPFPPGFKHSPEFHAQHPQLNNPTYYKPGTNDPVPITFPGSYTQNHPVHGYNNHASTPSEHGPSPSQMTHHPNYLHNGHHPHFNPNYHTNAPNFGWTPNNRNVEATTPTTASAPSPNSFTNQDKPTTVTRFGKTQYGEISTCDGQFDCGTGFCIPFSQLCDGRNDCGNRYDELNCPHVNYQVRLSNDKGHKHMGRVEVRAFGKWGYVCDDKFTLTNANVLCRELGFNMGAAEVKPNSFFPPNSNMPRGENMFAMDEVVCQGNETSLKECEFDGWGVSDCNAEEIVGVVCKVTVMQCPPNHWLCQESEECIPMEFMCDGIKDCTDGTDESKMHCNAKIEYRLMDGTELEGRVEVKYRGVWGTVCDDDFGDKEAAVFCTSLGFTGPATVVNKRHGMSTGPIWLDQVDCLGNETTLDKCMHFDWSESNCNHTEDVSVRCSHGSNSKSSRYISSDFTPPRLTNTRETHEYLREVQRSSKSIPDHSNMCGRVKVTAADDVEENIGQFRVISGSRTKRGHHPWQATIRARGRNGRSSHWCGAVIISKTHILTAAHCLIGFPKGAYFIRLGDHHSEIREESEVEIFIENWYIHEEFRKGQLMNNDIALILLKTPIQFTNYIQPICLPDRETVYEAGKNCTISGWGSIQYGKSTPSLDLKAASVPLIAQEVCRQKDIYGDEIMDTMFCAGFLDQTGVDACDGDSGGPLVCADENGVNSLYGIISWGQRCGDSTKPGVYVKVMQYLDWIKEKMNLIN